MHSRRALLYVPGDDRHKIEKAAGLSVDCICMDMEDGVAVDAEGPGPCLDRQSPRRSGFWEIRTAC